MADPGERSRVASHTEYARTRFRCLGCGESVPMERKRGWRTLCVRCGR